MLPAVLTVRSWSRALMRKITAIPASIPVRWLPRMPVVENICAPTDLIASWSDHAVPAVTQAHP